MTITVRLYRHTDLDLLLLCGAYGKRFARFASECLRSYIRNIPPYLAGMPDIEFVENHDSLVSSKYVGVSFSPTEDADILSFLKNNIRYGYRNNFIKNVLRFYAGRACVAAYCSTKDGYEYLKQSNLQPQPFFSPQYSNPTVAFPAVTTTPTKPKKTHLPVAATKARPNPNVLPVAEKMPAPIKQEQEEKEMVNNATADDMDVFNMFIRATS